MEAIPEAGGQESRSPWSCWKPRPWRCWQGRQGLAAAGTGRTWAPAPPFLPNAPGHTAHLAVLWPPLSCHWLPLVTQPRQLLSTPRTLPGASKETHKHPGPLASAAPTQHRGGRELPQEAEGPPSGSDGGPPALGGHLCHRQPLHHTQGVHTLWLPLSLLSPFPSIFWGLSSPLGSGSQPPISHHRATEPIPRPPQEATA